jgi:hypothetical protein
LELRNLLFLEFIIANGEAQNQDQEEGHTTKKSRGGGKRSVQR